ncbi:LolA family protein, partial [Pseudomaricurvus sp.]|uniref:LolA family protein n=1 Tax=Pseudomaricurvus sp. TaxID=2004510 RepID=UPI003F6B5A1F
MMSPQPIRHIYSLIILVAGLLSAQLSLATQPAPERTLESISQQLDISEQIHGDFIQRKYLSILPNPLQSSGTFTFQPDSGLVWETQQPLPSKLTFSPQGIMQEQNGEQVWLARADQPGVAVIGQIMAAIFTSDW